jgi:hypothetical protein
MRAIAVHGVSDLAGAAGFEPANAGTKRGRDGVHPLHSLDFARASARMPANYWRYPHQTSCEQLPAFVLGAHSAPSSELRQTVIAVSQPQPPARKLDFGLIES